MSAHAAVLCSLAAVFLQGAAACILQDVYPRRRPLQSAGGVPAGRCGLYPARCLPTPPSSAVCWRCSCRALRLVSCRMSTNAAVLCSLLAVFLQGAAACILQDVHPRRRPLQSAGGVPAGRCGLYPAGCLPTPPSSAVCWRCSCRALRLVSCRMSTHAAVLCSLLAVFLQGAAACILQDVYPRRRPLQSAGGVPAGRCGLYPAGCLPTPPSSAVCWRCSCRALRLVSCRMSTHAAVLCCLLAVFLQGAAACMETARSTGFLSPDTIIENTTLTRGASTCSVLMLRPLQHQQDLCQLQLQGRH